MTLVVEHTGVSFYWTTTERATLPPTTLNTWPLRRDVIDPATLRNDHVEHKRKETGWPGVQCDVGGKTGAKETPMKIIACVVRTIVLVLNVFLQWIFYQPQRQYFSSIQFASSNMNAFYPCGPFGTNHSVPSVLSYMTGLVHPPNPHSLCTSLLEALSIA